MYAVIFRSDIAELDEDYYRVATHLREIAIKKYQCVDFFAATEDKKEIAVSYWRDLEHIKQWKNDIEHVLAQEKGRSRYYKAYSVQVAKIEREYHHPNLSE